MEDERIAALHDAIQRNEITPAFQPLFEMGGGLIVGFEVLARWGARPASEFIELAESAGMLSLLTESLLRQATRQAVLWPGELSLAINISPTQLHDVALPGQILRALEASAFPASRLEIEVTHHALPGTLEDARTVAQQLKAMGISLVMDGFGAGHSSLKRLRALPFNKIKIDGSLVRSIGEDRDARKVVAAIIGLAASLGLKTVAEGVEDQSAADALKSLGCSASQGWLFGHPLPASEVPALILTNGLRNRVKPQFGDSPAPKSSSPQRTAQLEGAFATAPLGLATLDLDFRYTLVNEAFANMYGKRVVDFIGRSVEEALPRWASQILPHLERCLLTESTVECEIVADIIESGRPLVFLRTCKPVRNAQGEIIGLSSGLVDITERKNAEAAIRESEEHYRFSMEFNPHIPWTCGPDGERFEISSKWTQLTNLKSGSITLADWAKAPHQDDLPFVIAAWKEAQRTCSPLDVEYRVRCANGETRWIRARAFCRRDSSGRAVRWYGMNEDIDDRKRIDAALWEKTRKLELATEQLGMRVNEDHLTGLANRRFFDEVIAREIEISLRSKSPLCLIMLDVDHFKVFNDTYGHVAGDECLRRVAVAMQKAGHRSKDLAARYGGEEFAILLANTAEAAAVQVAQRVIEEVRALNIPHSGSASNRLTVSAGVAQFFLASAGNGPIEDATSGLIRAADAALYLSKNSGRDRVSSETFHCGLKQDTLACTEPCVPTAVCLS